MTEPLDSPSVEEMVAQMTPGKLEIIQPVTSGEMAAVVEEIGNVSLALQRLLLKVEGLAKRFK